MVYPLPARPFRAPQPRVIRLTHSTALPLGTDPARVIDHLGRVRVLWRTFPSWGGLLHVRSEGHEAAVVLRATPGATRWLNRITRASVTMDIPSLNATTTFSGPRLDPIHLISRVVPADDDTGGWRLDEAFESIALPGGFQRALEQWLRFRARRVPADLQWLDAERNDQPAGGRLYLLSGASGLLGRAISAYLLSAGHRVRQLVRREPRGIGECRWDPAAGQLDATALDDVHGVIHLSGENVAGARWSTAFKQRVLDSRVKSTNLLAQAMAALAADERPAVFVCASGAGYYGCDARGPRDEAAPAGTNDFLAHVCSEWEAACEPARDAGVRTVNLRMGVVVAAADGVLARLAPIFRFGIGGPIGNGRQPMSWAAIDDVVGAIARCLGDERLIGPVNVATPTTPTNREFTRDLGRALDRPAFLPVPSLAVNMLFGEMGRTVLLGGQAAIPAALQRVGHRFMFDQPQLAMRYELGRLRPRDVDSSDTVQRTA